MATLVLSIAGSAWVLRSADPLAQGWQHRGAVIGGLVDQKLLRHVSPRADKRAGGRGSRRQARLVDEDRCRDL
jgi:hypothetical protein